ncbi:hypothetical protein AB0K89_08175 [Streptomyces cinnamoneus]|uniref:hypothetical protein n=1 Tax=Streptomyces cinnamoneus TaxID=53446 RepID=UPI00342A6492
MNTEQQHDRARHRGRLARRASALMALVLGVALLATPAVAAAPSAGTVQRASVAVAGPAAAEAASTGTAADAVEVAAASHHKAKAKDGKHTLAKDKKKKKKKGFFKKLGVALLIVMILGTLFVVAMIVLAIFLIRRAFKRRRA